MESYDWDETKRAANVAKHGLDFAAMTQCDWTTAVVVPDTRQDYGEARFRAFGRIGTVACAVAYTRRGRTHRLISLRRANARQRRKYGI